jgi:hypothetical protein
MKGQTGVPMQGREWRKKKKTNGKKAVYCKYCKHLEFNISNKVLKSNTDKKLKKGKSKKQIYPYMCTVKDVGMFYTSKVVCNKFEPKEDK